MAAFYIQNFQLEEIAKRRERREEARRLSSELKPEQILILDTNTLFTKREDEIFNVKTAGAIRDCRKSTSVRVVIPRVCLLERLYQVNVAAIARFAKVQNELECLGRLTGSYLKNFEGPSDIRPLVYRRALDWCESNSISVKRTPINKMDWNSVIRDSIWRVPPFEPYSPDKKGEKGFRDRMVLATVNATANEHLDIPIAFVCADKLLRETAGQVHKGNPTFSAYSSIEEFHSALEIAKSDVSRWLADVVVKKAPKVFSVEIYTRLELPSKIIAGQSVNLYYLFQQIKGESGSLQPFIPLTEEKIKVGKTSFKLIDEHGRYHWQTLVGFSRGFKEGEGGLSKVRGAIFDVRWICRIAEDATFSEVSLDSVEFGGVIVSDLSSRKTNDIEREADVMLDSLDSDILTDEPEDTDKLVPARVD